MVPISYYIHAGRVTDPRMLSLTRKTEYALIALFHLARESERVCTAREISARYHLPPALLMNVLKCLASGDLLLSTRGAKGGYRLALPPEAISLSAIIAAVEGPVRFVQCVDEAAPCDIAETCPIRDPVMAIQARLETFLSDITLAELAAHSRLPESAGMVPVSIDRISRPEAGSPSPHGSPGRGMRDGV